jgi:hypothetical protein
VERPAGKASSESGGTNHDHTIDRVGEGSKWEGVFKNSTEWKKSEVDEYDFCTDFLLNSTDFSVNNVNFSVNSASFSKIRPDRSHRISVI